MREWPKRPLWEKVTKVSTSHKQSDFKRHLKFMLVKLFIKTTQMHKPN